MGNSSDLTKCSSRVQRTVFATIQVSHLPEPVLEKSRNSPVCHHASYNILRCPCATHGATTKIRIYPNHPCQPNLEPQIAFFRQPLPDIRLVKLQQPPCEIAHIEIILLHCRTRSNRWKLERLLTFVIRTLYAACMDSVWIQQYEGHQLKIRKSAVGWEARSSLLLNLSP